ncbi:MAG: IPT/TIG domain-containing protein [Candidatus Uhrbacteria bacterium]
MKNFHPSLKIILVAVLFSAAVFLVSHSALAATVSTNELFGGTNGANFASTAGLANVSLVLLIANIIRVALGFVGVVAVCFVIYAGFLWTTAGGEEEKIKKAKAVMKNALIGLVIILSSFAIAQFFISRITTAMGGGVETNVSEENGCVGSECWEVPDWTTTFVLNPLDTACAATIQNYQPRFVFSQRVNKAEITENSKIRIDIAGDEVAGTFTAVGGTALSAQTFIFTPLDSCEDVSGFFCFEPNTTFDVTIDPTLESSAGYQIDCSNEDFPCDFSFTTGSGLDVSAPIVTMQRPSTGDSLFADRAEPLQAKVVDDVGVSLVTFWVGGDDVYSTSYRTADSLVPDTYYFDGWWNTTGEVTNHEYTIVAEGSDCAGNSDSGSVNVMLRAATCDNDISDSGDPYYETGTCVDPEPCDCGGTGEYYCGACDGAECYNDGDCRSGNCENGICTSTIEIERVSPGDGAEGNLITISGSGFGTTAGTVIFLGVSDNESVLINSNSACGDWWSDSEIVVQVPTGAKDGPIKVTNSVNDKFDQTNDDNGSVIGDFDVNTTVRPGICNISPNAGQGGDSVAVSGKNFGAELSNSTFYFGSYEAASYANWNSDGTSFSVISPLLDSGFYDVQFFSGEADSRQGSNVKEFAVSTSSNTEPPVIIDVDSGLRRCVNDSTVLCSSDADCGGSSCLDAGPAGQYVTIYGSNFGTTQGTVRFQNQSTEYEGLGNNNFPDACESVYWSDDTIVIKVPAVYGLTQTSPAVVAGLHDLWVVRGGLSSDTIDFLVTAGEASPGICALVPDAGPVGTTVAIYGEGFEDDAGTVAPFGKVEFYNGVEVTPTPVTWDDGQILGNIAHPMSVPEGTETGPVFIVDKDGQESNSINFQVGMCDVDFTCATGQECCDTGACSSTTLGCGGAESFAAHYAYRFSTGDIPHNPAIQVECSAPGVSPRIVSPSPYEGWEGGTDVCSDAILHVSFTEDMNSSTFTASTILVKECVGDSCTTVVPMTVASSPTSRSFFWQPNYPEGSGWLPGKRYQVTVSGGETGVLSARGLGMLQNYVWYFETSADGEPCTVGGVLVDPAEYTANSICQAGDLTCTGAVVYSATPVSEEYECTLLTCDSGDNFWDFGSRNSTKAAVVDRAADIDPNTVGVQDSICDALALPYQETAVGSPVSIWFELNYGNGGERSVDGSGELTINFSDPQVSNYWPSCSEACLNAEIGLTFNLAMKVDTFANNRVKLFGCEDEACAPDEVTDVTSSLHISPVYTGDAINGIYQLIINHSDLIANTSYRVTVSKDAESDSGSTLAEAVGDMAWYNGDLTWTFTTGDATCEVDRVEVEPSSATLQRIGDIQRFTAVPFGTADDCSDEGQRLIASGYNWEAWTATDYEGQLADTIATVASLFGYSGTSPLRVASSLPVGCSSLCLNTGSPAPVAICGNNAVFDCDADSDCSVGEKCNVNNGQCVEPGEDCDGGIGCSTTCLNIGTTGSTCGNGTINAGEDCDFGASTGHPALTSHPGCSATCLSVGASSVGTTCGNGDVAHSDQAGGEECDYGNENSANNCSANCLNLGSESRSNYPAICGDGVVEGGEDCDDENTTNSDGCSSSCTNEGSSSIYNSLCGNGGVPQTGEDCDDENSVSGDGCSSSCLSEGSSDSRRAVCGNGVRETGEECEATSASATRIAPFVLAYISNTAQQEIRDQGGNSASSKITAKEDVSNKTGDGYLTLQCSCTTDASCNSTTDANSYGCGNSSCCFSRPTVLGRYPEISATSVCRNTAVWVNFSQPMDVEAVKNSGTLYLKLNKIDCIDASCTAGNSVDDLTECPESYTSVVSLTLENNEDENLLVRAWHWLRDNILQIFGAQATTISACLVPVNYTLVTPTKIGLDLPEALVANAEYSLFIMGESNSTGTYTNGAMSADGVDLLNNESSMFVTRADICTLDYVSVIDNGIIGADIYEDPSPGFFSSTGEQHTLTAAGFTLNGAVASQIQSITGVYSWAWGAWSSTEASDETIVNIPAATGTGTTTATSETQDGTVQAVISANITSVDSSGRTVNASVTGQTDLTTFLCSNPWPATRRTGGSYRFEDTSSSAVELGLSATGNFTNFAFSYCRDQAGSTDLLPSLTVREVTSVASTTIFKELLFLANNDAIGVRVLPNPNYLTPADWFADQGFTGSPSETTVDGYEAVQDGNTYYVSAVNSNDPVTSTKILYPNIYVISYNEGASDEMENIFGQVLDSWTFNTNDSVITDVNVCKDSVTITLPTEETVLDSDGQPYPCTLNEECDAGAGSLFCSDNVCKSRGTEDSISVNYVYDTDENLVSCDWDGDCQGVTQSGGTITDDSAFCDGEKAKLTRDLKRLTDARKIATIIDNYGQLFSYCSVTSDQLCGEDDDCPGNEICQQHVPPLISGTFLSSFTTSTWPSWTSELDNALGTTLPTDPINEFVGCHAGADENYCWDSAAGQFTCHEGSHVYLYQNLGGVAYKLGVQLEGSDIIGTWGYSLDDDSADNATLYAEYAYTSSSAESALTNPATSGGFQTTGPMCSNVTMGTSSSRCGDGVKATDNPNTLTVNEAEVCEIGEYESRTCTGGTQNIGCVETMVNSVSTCAWQTAATSACIPYSCGNGVKEGTELCDDGEENGTYGHCSQSCNGGSFSCGDGFIAGGEECDCYSTINWSSNLPATSWASINSCDAANGQYDTTYDDTCAFDCTFPGPSCGDGELNGPEVCDGGYESWSGSLCSAGTNINEECTVDSDCGTGGVCGNATGFQACNIARVCESSDGGIKDGYPCGSDCAAANGTCSSAEYQLSRTRTCNDAPGATCTWETWTACLGGDQVCGNGILEGDEECDDGNDDSTDDCTSECTVSVCGDDYVYAGHETCDNGNENGDVCSPEYDDTCSYCNINCQYTTVSGAYCGDATVQTGEFCDGVDSPRYCFSGSIDPSLRIIGSVCEQPADCATGYTCENVGACNGGYESTNQYYYNAEPCVNVVGSYSSSKECGLDESGDAGICVEPACANSCDATCPTTYESTSILIQTELAGASKQTSADLYDFNNRAGNSPDLATLFIPACEIGTAITADIDTTNWTPPSTDIVFVTDLSTTMGYTNTPMAPGTSISVATEVLSQTIDDLFDHIDELRIALVSFSGEESLWDQGLTTDQGLAILASACVTSRDDAVPLAFTDAGFTNIQSDLLYDSDHGVVSYASRLQNGTPTAAGLLCAKDLLSRSNAQSKIVILLSDGLPNVRMSDGSYGEAYSEFIDTAADEARVVTNELTAAGIKVYSAALPLDDSDTVLGYMRHFSSDDCDTNSSALGTCSLDGTTCGGDYPSCSSLGGCSNDPTITCADVEEDHRDSVCNDGIIGYCEDLNDEEELYDCWDDSQCAEGNCIFSDDDIDGYCSESIPQSCNYPANDPFESVTDCRENAEDGVEYAYSATTASGFTSMFDSILGSIVNMHIGLTTEVNNRTHITSGPVTEGNGVTIPFPEGFACNGATESEIPIKFDFNGTGTINISNISLNYCPIR